MKNAKINKHISLYTVFILILIYAIFDIQSSSNTGVLTTDRSNVYIILFLLLAFLGVHYIYNLLSKAMTISIFEIALWSITFWIIIVNLIRGNSLWTSLVHIGISILWIFIYSFFYNYVKKYPEVHNKILKFIMIMLLFYVGVTIYSKYSIQSIHKGTAVVNFIYYVLVFYPWTMLFSKNKTRVFSFMIIMIVVLLSVKRGAIIVFPLMTFIYYFVDGKIRNRRFKNTLRILLSVIVIFIGLFYIDKIYGGYLSDRFKIESLTSGSGRDIIYSEIISNIKNRNILDMLIGFGSGSTTYYIGSAAHNDWLEFLFSFGLIGFILHLNFYKEIIGKTLRLFKSRSLYCSSYAMVLTYMIFIGFIGMVYFAHSSIYIFALFGTINGLAARKTIRIYK